MRSDPSPRPPECYDPTIAPHRDGDVVHVHDHATVRGLLRDAHRVTADVSEVLTADERDRVHPVAAFVWATDRRTISGVPGKHAVLRTAMGPWLTASTAADRVPVARAIGERPAVRERGEPFDVFDDYALPLVVAATADWLGVEREDVRYAVDDQLAAGEMFDAWPPLATPEMDERYRELLRRPRL